MTQEQIIEERRKYGIPEGGVPKPPASPEVINQRLQEFNDFRQQKYQQSSPYNTGSIFTSPSLPYEQDDNVAEVSGKALFNLPTSAARGVKDLGSAALNVFNPNPEKNTLSNIAKVGAGALEKGVGRITGKDIETEDTQKFDALVQGLKQRYGSVDNIKRTIAEDPAGVLFDVATALEGGGALATKAGAKTVGTAIKTAGEAINPVRIGAKVGGEATAVAGRATKGAGEAIYKSAITPNVSEAEKILRYKADQPFLKRATEYLEGGVADGKPRLRSDTALQKGIAGRETTIGIKATREAENLWKNKIQPAVKSSDAVVTKEDLFRPIVDRIERTAEPGRKLALQEAFEAIQDEYAKVENLSLDQAQAIKRGLDEFTPEKVFRGKSVVNEYRTLKNEMANAIRSKTYDALKSKDIKKAYVDYGNLSELKKIGVKAISESGLKGGFGNFWTSMWDMATIPVRTMGGKYIYQVGKKLEFVGDKGIKRFGDFLKAKGFERPTGQ